jgi:DNA-binding Xre family transcriptional regulator
MHKKNISKIETGLRKVAADELPFFAKALDCRVEDLLEPAE